MVINRHDLELRQIEQTTLINPFEEIEDDLEWLNLDYIPKKVSHPFNCYNVGDIIPDPVDELTNIFLNPDYLHFAVRALLNMELPPYQCTILDTLWSRRLPMLIGGRGSSKSRMLATYCLLRMIFHPGCNVVIVGNGLRQSRQVFDYMVKTWNESPVLRDIAGKGRTVGPRREIDRFQFEIGDSHTYAIPLGQGDKIRGLRANYVICDEFSSINEEVFNVVVQGFAIVASDPVEKVKEYATIKKLKKCGQWSDEMEALFRSRAGGNQIVCSGTAYYSFNHFYKRFKQWHDIIASKGDPHRLASALGSDESLKNFQWKDYAILRIPYNEVPEGMLDANILNQARATLSRSQFLMEYCACFISDTDGFYRRSILEAATCNKPIVTLDGLVQFNAQMTGDRKKSYVMAIDPAADKDNAAIVLLELNVSHRKIAHVWTTNKKKYNDLRKYMEAKGKEVSEDYYRYIAMKIRQFMREFPIEHIIMDKNGGGTAIAESLKSIESYEAGELPIYPIIDPDEPKPDDIRKGLHILELLAPTMEINADANHGMLKDFQDKVLIFPMFNSIEVAKSIEIDVINNLEFDGFEDLLEEVEELKNEITSIVVTPSSNIGKETFDTPSIKLEGMKKGRLRKDRYSALLYANFYARNKNVETAIKIQYNPVGRRRGDGEDDPYITKKTVAPTQGGYYRTGAWPRVKTNANWINDSVNSVGFVKHTARPNPNQNPYGLGF